MQYWRRLDMTKIPSPFGMRPGDAAVIAAVLLCAFFLFFVRTDSAYPEAVSVRCDEGEIRFVLPQEKDCPITSAGHTLTLSIRGYEVSVTEADCPGGDCMHSGVIRRGGQSIVCIPARVVITLVGEEVSDADWILP